MQLWIQVLPQISVTRIEGCFPLYCAASLVICRCISQCTVDLHLSLFAFGDVWYITLGSCSWLEFDMDWIGR